MYRFSCFLRLIFCTCLFRPNSLCQCCYLYLLRRSSLWRTSVVPSPLRLDTYWALMFSNGVLLLGKLKFFLCIFVSRLSSFSTSWSFRCQSTYSLLTGRGHVAKQAGPFKVTTYLHLSLYFAVFIRSKYPADLFHYHICCHIIFQLLVSQNASPLQSASGGPILWPTNGMRSRPSARSAQLFRSWLCYSFLKYISPQHSVLSFHLFFIPLSKMLTCHSVLFRCWVSLIWPWGTHGQL